MRYLSWTGGSRPLPLSQISHEERQLVKAIFRERCKTYSEFWAGRMEIERARVFWKWSRYDAHATMREAQQ